MINVRDMKPEDIPQVMQIEQAIYDEPWETSHFLFQLQRAEHCNWVAVDDQGICAYINCCKWQNELHLNNIAVREDVRCRGIAQILLDRALVYAKEHQLGIVKLEVNENNQCALDFYKKNGFSQTGLIPDYYEERSSNALILSKIMEKM